MTILSDVSRRGLSEEVTVITYRYFIYRQFDEVKGYLRKLLGK